MEQDLQNRIASILILVQDRQNVSLLNQIISEYADIVIGRQGIRLHERQKSIISLVLEGNTDQIGALSGKLGQLTGIQVKSVILKN